MKRRELCKAGDTFSRLTVVKETPSRGYMRYFLCKCACGNEKEVAWGSLQQGGTKSCGCLHKERASAGKMTHGHNRTNRMTGTYRSWISMLARCRNPNMENYHHYGGRGIKVCESWLNYEMFFADMGERPEGMTLDRINVDGNYEPSNCRWADKITQQLNKRGTKEHYLKLLSQTPEHSSDEFLEFLRTKNIVEYEDTNWLTIRNIKYWRKKRPWLTAFAKSTSRDLSPLESIYGDWTWLKKAADNQSVKRFHIHLYKEKFPEGN